MVLINADGTRTWYCVDCKRIFTTKTEKTIQAVIGKHLKKCEKHRKWLAKFNSYCGVDKK